MLRYCLKVFFFGFVVKPLMFLIFGLSVKEKINLPTKGPAILAPNHNSHLDTMALMSLFPLKTLPFVRPVAAADYFMRGLFRKFLSIHILGIIPIDRQGAKDKDEIIRPLLEALQQNDILIIFPEGSRGEPEKMVPFKKGIGHIVKQNPLCAVHPVFMFGMGKSWPKGKPIPVPFQNSVIIGEPISGGMDPTTFTNILNEKINQLSKQCKIVDWLT